METTKNNLVDISRLYSLRGYSKKFNVPYATIYGNLTKTLSGRARNPLKFLQISGVDFVYVSSEQEKELLSKVKKSK